MDDKELIEQAAAARMQARTFSGFRVGAALLTRSGEIITGCNVEIHSTRSSICAERTALVRAVAMGHQDFEAVAVVSDADHPVSPCGFCRQYLLDFNPDMRIIMANSDASEVVEKTARQLLPMPFIVGDV